MQRTLKGEDGNEGGKGDKRSKEVHLTLIDKTLVCRDCGREFTFTVGEQEFYSSHGLLNEPKHCPKCRAAWRRQRSTGGGSRQVYCRDCYAKIRGSQ